MRTHACACSACKYKIYWKCKKKNTTPTITLDVDGDLKKINYRDDRYTYNWQALKRYNRKNRHTIKRFQRIGKMSRVSGISLGWFEEVFRALKSDFLSKMRGSCFQRIGKISRVSWISLGWFEEVFRALKSDFLSKMRGSCFQRIGRYPEFLGLV